MALHDDQVSLQQMLDSTRRALYLASRRSRLDLDDDWVATLALMQLLQIIGEAARRLSDGVRQQHPAVPWAHIIGLRNRLIHGYDTVDLDRLWEVLTVDLPELAANLGRILASRG
jgi:uncharacterized protein with HEPN domain